MSFTLYGVTYSFAASYRFVQKASLLLTDRWGSNLDAGTVPKFVKKAGALLAERYGTPT